MWVVPADPLPWPVVVRTAHYVTRHEPFSTSYLASRAEEELHELTSLAQGEVAAITGLGSSDDGGARIVTRHQWIDVNVAVVRHVFGPMLVQHGAPRGPLQQLGRAGAAAELGALLGWVSSRVLGQYVPSWDGTTGPAADAWSDQLLYSLPNLMAMEKRYGFPPREFRLWVALHECTHRAQFCGVPWLVQHLRSEMQVVMGVDQQARSGPVQALLRRKDVPGTSAAPPFAAMLGQAQQEALDRLGAAMSLLEGHADVVMSQAPGSLLPNAERFARVVSDRRRRSSAGLAGVLSRLIGMQAKLEQYRRGAAFVREVQATGGAELLAEAWMAPDRLPSGGEIAEPARWIARVRAQ